MHRILFLAYQSSHSLNTFLLCRPWFDQGSHRTNTISSAWTCLDASVWIFLRYTNAETLEVISGIRVFSSCQAILMAEMLGNVLYLFLFSLLDFAVPLKGYFKHCLSWDHLILCSALLALPFDAFIMAFSCIFSCKHVLTLSWTVLKLKDRACVCSSGLSEVLYQ